MTGATTGYRRRFWIRGEVGIRGGTELLRATSEVEDSSLSAYSILPAELRRLLFRGVQVWWKLLVGLRALLRGTGSFDRADDSLRESSASLRMTGWWVRLRVEDPSLHNLWGFD
jgi:hypothetical protein